MNKANKSVLSYGATLKHFEAGNDADGQDETLFSSRSFLFKVSSKKSALLLVGSLFVCGSAASFFGGTKIATTKIPFLVGDSGVSPSSKELETMISSQLQIKEDFKQALISSLFSSYYSEEELRSWEDYRLGDVFNGYLAKKLSYEGVLEEYKSKWPLSIATEYLERTSAKYDWNVMGEIVDERAKNSPENTPCATCLNVHLRLGDVLGDQFNQHRSMDGTWEYGDVYGGKYVKSRHYYEDIIAKLQKDQITLVTVCGSVLHGCDNDRCIANNEDYRSRVLQLFNDAGFWVKSRSSGLPDDDFTFMATSKFFIQGGGGFSSIIGHLVQKSGGQVFGQ